MSQTDLVEQFYVCWVEISRTNNFVLGTKKALRTILNDCPQCFLFILWIRSLNNFSAGLKLA